MPKITSVFSVSEILNIYDAIRFKKKQKKQTIDHLKYLY